MTTHLLRRCSAVIGKLVSLWLVAFTCVCAWAQDKAATGDSDKNVAADKAWQEVVKAARPPSPPAEWSTNRPSREEISKFYGPLMVKAADKAKDFYTQYPAHAKAAEARKQEYQLLQMVVMNFGVTNQSERFAALQADRAKDPNLSEDDRFKMREQAVEAAAMKKKDEGMPAVFAEFEKGARELQKEFPKQPEVYNLLLAVASNSDAEKARALAKEIAGSSAPDQIKEQAKGLLESLDAIGKPVDIKFTAVDGRTVDVSKMPGKVVLVDFWATWCGPCVEEIPNVKAAYNRLHPKGFEIVGISFDQEKDALTSFVSDKKMTWPQYFDGKGWENKFGQKFGIHAIPAMWLVDKKGNLRDIEGRGDLETKVAKLLDEK